jgi:hypothetical protein
MTGIGRVLWIEDTKDAADAHALVNMRYACIIAHLSQMQPASV